MNLLRGGNRFLAIFQSTVWSLWTNSFWSTLAWVSSAPPPTPFSIHLGNHLSLERSWLLINKCLVFVPAAAESLIKAFKMVTRQALKDVLYCQARYLIPTTSLKGSKCFYPDLCFYLSVCFAAFQDTVVTIHKMQIGDQ